MAGLNELKSWVIQVNKRLTDKTGENHALLRPESLESALGSLGQSWYNDEQAIASCYKSLILNHPFENGNKRTAVAVLQALKQPTLSGNEVYSLTVKIASEGGGKIEVNEIANALFGTNYPVIKPRLDKLSTDPIKRKGWNNRLVKGKRNLKEDGEFDNIEVSDEPIEVTVVDTVVYPRDKDMLPDIDDHESRKSIKHVIFEEGTQIIGTGEFSFCPNLTSVKFPSGLKRIGFGAFCQSGLKSVILPAGLESVGGIAFSNCKDLTKVFIPKGVHLVANVFYDNAGLNRNGASKLTIYCEEGRQPRDWDMYWNSSNAKVVWGYKKNKSLHEDADEFDDIKVSDEPAEVTVIDFSTIVYPRDMGKIPLSDALTRSYVKKVVFEPGLIEIGYGAFARCSGLESVQLPSTLKQLRYGAFFGCSNLKTVIVPDGVKTIEGSAFAYCDSLVSIYIPDSVIDMSGWVFEGVSGDKELTIYCASASQPSSWNERWNRSGRDIRVIWGFKLDVTSRITEGDEFDDIITSDEPAEVHVAEYDTFIYPKEMSMRPIENSPTRNNIKRIVFEDGVTTIAVGAFAHCSDVENVTLPKNLKRIEYGGFYGCKSLREIELPDGLEYLGESVFNYCYSLKTLYIPRGVEIAGSLFESRSSSMTYLTILCEDESQPDNWAPDWNNRPRGNANVVWGYKKDEPLREADGEKDEFDDIEVTDEPVEVGEINKTYYYPDMEDIAMSRNDKNSYTHVVVQPGTVRINDGAFYAFNMAYVSIPDSVTLIGWGAFDSCKSLKSIILPKHIANTGYQAFQFCESLETVIIPDSVTRISSHTFRGCKSLKSITLPESVTEIGNSAFSDCSSLKQIVVPNNVTSISSSAFSGCTSLESVTLPNRINVINFGTFQGCTALKSIVIPDTVTTVSHLAFKDCNKLKSFIYKGQTYKSSLALRRAIKNEHDLNNPDQWAAL